QRLPLSFLLLRFFSTGTVISQIYTLSLHDALPISSQIDNTMEEEMREWLKTSRTEKRLTQEEIAKRLGISESYYCMIEQGERQRSEEHTSELQSRFDLVCRLLLEKKKLKNH